MKKTKLIVATLIAIVMAFVLSACGGKKETPSGQEATTEEVETNKTETMDFSSMNWIQDELDCYGYKNADRAYYVSFEYPETFQSNGYDESGEQSRNYWYSQDGSNASNSLYGIYAVFLQGGYGGYKDTIQEGLVGGEFEERELGGTTVLFGLMDDSQNPEASGYTYSYYVSYDDDDWSRIWILVQDQEEDGAFRQYFEDSLNFTTQES